MGGLTRSENYVRRECDGDPIAADIGVYGGMYVKYEVTGVPVGVLD